MTGTPVEAKTEEPGQIRPPLSRKKRLVFRLISVILSLSFVAIAGEILLRVLPMGHYRTAPFRQYDPVIGIALIPNMKVVHSRGCYTGLVETNRWGFRDRDRTLEKPPGVYRIALIGDSVVEAEHVRPEQVMNIQMEQLLQRQGYKNIEVMNFSVEGIGTTQEFLIYREHVRQFHPDLVLLLFSNNDVWNNSSTLQPKIYGIHTWYAAYYDLGGDGNLVFRPVESRPFNTWRAWLERHSYLFYYLERIWMNFDPLLYKWHGFPLYYQQYEDDPVSPEWKQAWMVTEKVLAMMKQTVEADGAKFALVTQPDTYATDPQWRERMMKNGGTVPAEFNPPKFYERLQNIAAQAGVTTLSEIPYLQAYRAEHNLQYPFFSFTCDPHFSALGHEVVAEALVQELQKNHLIAPPAGAQ